MDTHIVNQKWKVNALEEFIASENVHVPFFCLTETHLKDYHKDAEINIDNYRAFRANRSFRIRGDAAIYVGHNSLVADSIELFFLFLLRGGYGLY